MADQPVETSLVKTSPTSSGPVIVPMRPASERRSLARRSVGAVRRWARDTFSREQLLASMKALAWVAPLALLIWIYAEREQQDKQQASFQVTVRSADASQTARIKDNDGNGIVT